MASSIARRLPTNPVSKKVLSLRRGGGSAGQSTLAAAPKNQPAASETRLALGPASAFVSKPLKPGQHLFPPEAYIYRSMRQPHSCMSQATGCWSRWWPCRSRATVTIRAAERPARYPESGTQESGTQKSLRKERHSERAAPRKAALRKEF